MMSWMLSVPRSKAWPTVLPTSPISGHQMKKRRRRTLFPYNQPLHLLDLLLDPHHTPSPPASRLPLRCTYQQKDLQGVQLQLLEMIKDNLCAPQWRSPEGLFLYWRRLLAMPTVVQTAMLCWLLSSCHAILSTSKMLMMWPKPFSMQAWAEASSLLCISCS